jgi:hypothetical protein
MRRIASKIGIGGAELGAIAGSDTSGTNGYALKNRNDSLRLDALAAIGANRPVSVQPASGVLRRQAPATHAALHEARGTANYDSMSVVQSCGISSGHLAMYTTFRSLSGRLIGQLLVLLPAERRVRFEKWLRGCDKGYVVRIFGRRRRDGSLEIVRKVC